LDAVSGGSYLPQCTNGDTQYAGTCGVDDTGTLTGTCLDGAWGNTTCDQ